MTKNFFQLAVGCVLVLTCLTLLKGNEYTQIHEVAPCSPNAQTPPPPASNPPPATPNVVAPPAPVSSPPSSPSDNAAAVATYDEYVEEVNRQLGTPDLLFQDTVMGMFSKGYTEETMANIKAIRELHATYPEDRPKACAFMLAFPTRCGDPCIRGNKHDQSWNVMHMAAALEAQIWSSPGVNFHYPVVIYHDDYTAEQKAAVESATKSKIFWFQVNFGAASLPDYISREDINEKVAHQHYPHDRTGNIELPHSRKHFHGFGYRNMCRFFGGIIFHSPLVREFDYYWRLDGGDSRLRWPNRPDDYVYDIFKDLKVKNRLYGYIKLATSQESPRFDEALKQFKPLVPELMARFFTNGTYNGNYYYNNFEVVHIPTFQSKQHWEIFSACDRNGAFFFGATEKNGLGDADFRSGVLGYLNEMSPEKVHAYSDIGYAHPVPWDDNYPATWVGDFKWEGDWLNLPNGEFYVPLAT
eukprot:CAMPEP_0182502192 /NCGR_PEP_ID=MMETSP1321-20130603/12968_1 /TAXON_ID=91990 /ORGANISM="Bolidomonas sp., Strain RCC1657" /LENGTH=468 /DNA_ID=CAMNT_0024707027 /DNA_START=39 /DNA_END=1445 /DNA_ORIENTATION=-